MSSNEDTPEIAVMRRRGDEDFPTSTDTERRLREKAFAEAASAAAAEMMGKTDRRSGTLAALRKARGLTQHQLTYDLGMTQGEISRLERRENLHLATLARFVEATGGRLRITAVYDDGEFEIGLGSATSADEE